MPNEAKEVAIPQEIESPIQAVAEIWRDPTVVLAEARTAAKALTDIIRQKAKPVIINGEQYLEYEDWQTIGAFYGVEPRTGEATPVEIDGVKGAKAIATLLDRHGRVVGGAEAYCMTDEPRWKGKPWFQMASMAQTRAVAKALRNRFAWVVVLAGYRPTPAEEMDGVFEGKQLPKPFKATTGLPVTENGGRKGIDAGRIARFWIHAKDVNVTNEEAHQIIRDEYGYASLKDVLESQFLDLLGLIEKYGKEKAMNEADVRRQADTHADAVFGKKEQ